MSLNIKSWQIRTTALFSIVYFAYYLCRYNYPLALPFIKAEFGTSAFQIGLIATALTLGYGFGQLINGFLTDRIGPKIIMTFGGIIAAVANLLMGANLVFSLFILIWAVNGYFQAMGYPATCKLISNWFPKENERGKPLGMSEMFQSAASIAIIPFSAFLAISFGWRYIFFIPAFILFALSLVNYVFGRDSPYPKQVNVKPIWSEMRESYGKAFGDLRLLSAYFSYGFAQFVRYAMITWIPIYLFTVTGQDLFKAAWISTAFQFGGLIGSPIIGVLNDKYFHSRKWLLISIGMLVSGIVGSFIGVVPPSNVLLIIIILLVCGAFIEALEVAYFLTPIDYLGQKMSATGVGCMNAVGKLTASLQGVILGLMIDMFGYYSAFITAGVFAVVATILIIPSRKRINVAQVVE